MIWFSLRFVALRMPDKSRIFKVRNAGIEYSIAKDGWKNVDKKKKSTSFGDDCEHHLCAIINKHGNEHQIFPRS